MLRVNKVDSQKFMGLTAPENRVRVTAQHKLPFLRTEAAPGFIYIMSLTLEPARQDLPPQSWVLEALDTARVGKHGSSLFPSSRPPRPGFWVGREAPSSNLALGFNFTASWVLAATRPQSPRSEILSESQELLWRGSSGRHAHKVAKALPDMELKL